MKTVRLLLPDMAATEALGRRIGACLEKGDAVLLSGAIGAGKSTLARALIRDAADDPDLDVPSPTFTLVQEYVCAGLILTHFDLYRIAGPDEMVELGWDEALAEGAVVVEWPERLGAMVPENRVEVDLENMPQSANEQGRRAHLTGFGRFADLVDGLVQ